MSKVNRMDNLERFLQSLLHVGVMVASREIGLGAQKALARAFEKKDWAGILGYSLIYGGSVYAFHSSGRELNRLLGNPRAPLPSFYDLDDKLEKDIRYFSR
jgi:hypothetical protein